MSAGSRQRPSSSESKATVHIRPAVAGDVALILAFIRELADYERLLDRVSATQAQLHNALFGAQPCAEVLLAELNGAAVGFALFFPNFSTFLAMPGIHLEDLYVRESARGHGVGLALIANVAQLVVTRGGGRFEWNVLDWNSPAIAFYRSLGAVAQDDWTGQRLSGQALLELAARAS
jgi:GNAT superfamily N-acetyltransferase